MRHNFCGLPPGASGGYSIEAMAEAVVQLLRDLRVSCPHVVGYSLGARVALAMAISTGAQILLSYLNPLVRFMGA